MEYPCGKLNLGWSFESREPVEGSRSGTGPVMEPSSRKAWQRMGSPKIPLKKSHCPANLTKCGGRGPEATQREKVLSFLSVPAQLGVLAISPKRPNLWVSHAGRRCPVWAQDDDLPSQLAMEQKNLPAELVCLAES